MIGTIQIAGQPTLFDCGFDVACRPMGIGDIFERGGVGDCGNLVFVGGRSDQHARKFRTCNMVCQIQISVFVAGHDTECTNDLFNNRVRRGIRRRKRRECQRRAEENRRQHKGE